MTMSLWDELLPKLTKISSEYSKNIQQTLDVSLAALDEFAKESLSGRFRIQDKRDLAKQLRCIDEIEDETKTPPAKVVQPTEADCANRSELCANSNNDQTPSPVTDAAADQVTVKAVEVEMEERGSKKRNKEEMGGNNTPDQDKRMKRNASVRAQGIISKQVNVNLTAKLRRPLENEGQDGNVCTDDNKENRTDNVLLVQVKQEKISLVVEEQPLEASQVPEVPEASEPATDVRVKEEAEDVAIMPPPSLPAPSTKTRKGREKKKPDVEKEEEPQEEGGRMRRSTRAQKKDPPTMEVRMRASTRSSTRASTRQTHNQDSEVSQEEEMPPPPDPRPKRTRTKKQQNVMTESEDENASQPTVDRNEKPRPKRTRRGRKASTKEDEPVKEAPTGLENSPLSSPIISAPAKKLKKARSPEKMKEPAQSAEEEPAATASVKDTPQVIGSQEAPGNLQDTQTMERDNAATVNQTVSAAVQPNIAAEPNTPTREINMNETVVIEKHSSERETIVLSKAPILNETVVIDTNGKQSEQLTNDDSLLTEDNSNEIEDTPPRSMIPVKLPTSAVKERVQQFEQLANGVIGSGPRLTRTKTRALAKQSSDPDSSPSDDVQKLTATNLAKLNSLFAIKNTLANQVTSSATKPRSNIVSAVKSFLPASATKPTAPPRREEERDKEDARKKKEAILEAKREEQKKRREQKMAAAAAARDAQARSRAAQLEAKAQGWQEKQAYVDQGKLEKLKEAERKRAALEKKAAETEERRRAEESARQARLEEEHRRAELARRKMQEEAERVKKEEQQMEREMHQARQLYMEKEKEKERQKLLMQKYRMETDKVHTPMKGPATPCKPMAPVHMADGFQYLCSDEDEVDERPKRAAPEWSRSKARLIRLQIQDKVDQVDVDRLFSVQRHTPDLRELFPGIDRRNLKRTSSAVWRTPPRLPQLPEDE